MHYPKTVTATWKTQRQGPCYMTNSTLQWPKATWNIYICSISWASKLLWWDANALVISHCKMHCLFNFHCSWRHSFALCKHVLTKRVEECEGLKEGSLGVWAGKTQGRKGGFRVGWGVQEEVRSVQESWRVVGYLHAQSLLTLHQAAANREREGWRARKRLERERQRFEKKMRPRGERRQKDVRGNETNRLNGDEKKFGEVRDIKKSES